MHCTCSFTVQIYHSTSRTSSARSPPPPPPMGSNCPSIRTSVIWKPCSMYSCWICLTESTNVSIFMFWIASLVPKWMLCDMLTRKHILLTVIMSAARTTCWYCSMIGSSIVLVFTSTSFPLHQTVFPFSNPRFGPKMSSAACMSALDTGQFGSRLLSRIHR